MEAVLFVVVAMFVWTVGDAGPYEMDIFPSSNDSRIANEMATQVVANYRFLKRLLKCFKNRCEGCQDPSLRSRMRAQVPRMQAFVAESASFNLRGFSRFSTRKTAIGQSYLSFCGRGSPK